MCSGCSGNYEVDDTEMTLEDLQQEDYLDEYREAMQDVETDLG